jgi:hypothetical protein
MKCITQHVSLRPGTGGRRFRTTAFAALLACVASAVAWAGYVAPPSASVECYSLADAAKATAVYNTGISVGSSDTPDAPDVPFEIVEGDTTVDPGTYLYLPIFHSDDSSPVDPGFPQHIKNQNVDAAFLDNLVLNNFGVTAFVVQVDGKTTTLDDSYITGVTTPPLLDGDPAGTHYISIAAFITPLPPGDHTVGFGGLIDGSPVIFGSFEITVSPDKCDSHDRHDGDGDHDENHGRVEHSNFGDGRDGR